MKKLISINNLNKKLFIVFLVGLLLIVIGVFSLMFGRKGIDSQSLSKLKKDYINNNSGSLEDYEKCENSDDLEHQPCRVFISFNNEQIETLSLNEKRVYIYDYLIQKGFPRQNITPLVSSVDSSAIIETLYNDELSVGEKLLSEDPTFVVSYNLLPNPHSHSH